MHFSEVIGQTALKEKLIALVSDNRLGHALLFLDPHGGGGLPLALALAQYLVCEKYRKASGPAEAAPSLFGMEEPAVVPQIPSDSCGTCPSCLKAAGMVHPDIHFTFPVVNKKSNSGYGPVSKDYISDFRNFILKQPYANEYEWLQYIGAENRQGNITSDETKEILHNMHLKSFESGYKITIIWKPEALRNEGNKLLKIIEEPPPHSLFILVAGQDQLILPTILSRTQLIKVPALTAVEIAAALEERENIPEEQAKQLAMISGGNYFSALQLLRDASEDLDTTLRNWLNLIIKNNLPQQIQWLDTIARFGREKQKQFLLYFLHMLHHAIRLEALGIDHVNKEGTESANKLAAALNRFDLSQKAEMAALMETNIYHIERNANAKILFHALTIRLYHIIRNKSLILNH